jgi:predicted transcriptional regulator YdeE
MELYLSFVDLPELRLLVAQAETFPEGAAAAFERVESGLPTLRGRKLYGVVYTTPEGVRYYAGVVPEDEQESERLGLPVLTVPAGPYARANLMHWEEHRDDIGPVVDQMIESVDYDPSRPVLEFYRSSFELQLHVPVGG